MMSQPAAVASATAWMARTPSIPHPGVATTAKPMPR